MGDKGNEGGKVRGRAGEAFAARRLEELGYRILARNAHSPYGEVDIVAEGNGFLCFVEVKTRRRNAMVGGAEAVGPSKQRRIIRTALHYMQRHPELEGQPRFDLFTVVTGSGGEPVEYDYLEGAFDGEQYG